MSKRIEYIDIARGLGIMLVVMGHNDFSLVSPLFYKFIYSFHMPLFFFLSGIFFKPQISLLTLVQLRFKSLLKPYLVTILLIFFMSLSFTKIDIYSATIHVIKALYANGHYIDWAQLWFLPHLFALNIYALLFYKLAIVFRYSWIKWVLLSLTLGVGVLLFGVFWPFTFNLVGRSFTFYGLPLSLDIILVSGFFFVLGYEINRILPGEFFARPLVLVVSIISLGAMVIFLPSIIDFDSRVFESLPINTIEALLGILFILALSRQIEHIPSISSMFQYIGKTSLFILIFHLPIQESLGIKFLGMTGNQTLSYWFAYLAGIILPILINYFAIQPNPIIRSWFGQSPKTEVYTNHELLPGLDT